MNFTKLLICGLLLVVLPMPSILAAPHDRAGSSRNLDKQTEAILDLIGRAELQQARVLARQLATQFPDYALGQLLSAELETAAIGSVLATGDSPMSKALVNLLLEARARLADSAKQDNSDKGMPADVIQLGPHIKQVLIVDLQESTLQHWVSSQGSSSLVRQHYVSSGKAGFGKNIEGDNKTPLGVYSITTFRSDESLPDLYGSGALTLDYPNALDRHHGRTGSGIWLHGVPHSQRSRAPRSSEGCVTMSNDHLLALKHQVSPDEAVVVLSQGLAWLDEAEQAARQEKFRELFTRYQSAWINNHEEELSALYASKDGFEARLDSNTSLRRTVGTPVEHQDAENSQQTTPVTDYLMQLANVKSDEISLFLNPSLSGDQRQETLVMQARFGNLNEIRLTIYWAKQADETWRIVTDQADGLDT